MFQKDKLIKDLNRIYFDFCSLSIEMSVFSYAFFISISTYIRQSRKMSIVNTDKQ
jgi:hypothetical protein